MGEIILSWWKYLQPLFNIYFFPMQGDAWPSCQNWRNCWVICHFFNQQGFSRSCKCHNEILKHTGFWFDLSLAAAAADDAGGANGGCENYLIELFLPHTEGRTRVMRSPVSSVWKLCTTNYLESRCRSCLTANAFELSRQAVWKIIRALSVAGRHRWTVISAVGDKILNQCLCFGSRQDELHFRNVLVIKRSFSDGRGK